MDTNIIDTYKSIYIYSLLSIKIRFNIINDDICKDKPELLDEFKEYTDIIDKAIELFDIEFDYYIKKLEPEILKYFVSLYFHV